MSSYPLTLLFLLIPLQQRIPSSCPALWARLFLGTYRCGRCCYHHMRSDSAMFQFERLPRYAHPFFFHCLSWIHKSYRNLTKVLAGHHHWCRGVICSLFKQTKQIVDADMWFKDPKTMDSTAKPSHSGQDAHKSSQRPCPTQGPHLPKQNSEQPNQVAKAFAESTTPASCLVSAFTHFKVSTNLSYLYGWLHHEHKWII
jgi:hypothetical protein